MAVSLLMASNFGWSQTSNWCGAVKKEQDFIKANPQLVPQMKKAKLELEAHTLSYSQNKKATTIFIVPVVFHIMHDNGAENISDAKVHKAMRELNDDYRKNNTDLADVVSSFQSIIGDANVQFRLAQIDPSGNPTTGIDRVQTIYTDDPAGQYESNIKAYRWSVSKYLNIYSCKDIGGTGLLGYSYNPTTASFSPWIDGVMIKYSALGGRTLTHEIGHYLNLMHPWGPSNDAGVSTNCSIDDGVSDTPNTIGTSFGCNTSQNTCSSLDNVQNFMDYASCEVMFTEGQVTRLRAALTSGTANRNNLWTVVNLIATGLFESAAEFTTELTEICAGSTINFYDESYNGITSWDWSFPGGTPDSSDLKNPTITYNNPGAYNVALTVANDTGSTSTTKTAYINVSPPTILPYSEPFNTGMDWTIIDEGGVPWEYSAVSYSGSGGSIRIDNFSGGTFGAVDVAMGPVIDMSVLVSAKLNFKVAYAQQTSGDNDILKILSSNDCGNSWISGQTWINGGTGLAGSNGAQTSSFTPADSTQWQEFTTTNITDSALTENYRFKFEFISKGGNNIYLDEVNIIGVYSNTPILVSPANYATQQQLSLTLDWNAVSGVDSYHYLIDTVSTFNSPFLITESFAYIDSADNGTDTEYQLSGLDSSNTVYWKVRTIAGIDTSNYSSTWRFNTALSFADGIDYLASFDPQLQIYPNPSQGSFVVAYKLPDVSTDVSIEIFTLLGNKIEGKYYSGQQHAQVEEFVHIKAEPGIYIVKLSLGTMSHYQKIVISE